MYVLLIPDRSKLTLLMVIKVLADDCTESRAILCTYDREENKVYYCLNTETIS